LESDSKYPPTIVVQITIPLGDTMSYMKGGDFNGLFKSRRLCP
jgi:hypothetical protein